MLCEATDSMGTVWRRVESTDGAIDRYTFRVILVNVTNGLVSRDVNTERLKSHGRCMWRGDLSGAITWGR